MSHSRLFHQFTSGKGAQHSSGGNARRLPVMQGAQLSQPQPLDNQASVQTQTRRSISPRGLFIPESYEPGYAYPLLIWLHDAGDDERAGMRVFPKISTRNYVGLALRGNVATRIDSSSFGWSSAPRDAARVEDEVYAAVLDVRRKLHVHSERLFIAGSGAGGTMAWRLLLSRPDWFAGGAVIGGSFPPVDRPLRHYAKLRGKSLFVAMACDHQGRSSDLLSAGELMHAAGLDVTTRLLETAPLASPAVLRDVDRWIMRAMGCG